MPLSQESMGPAGLTEHEVEADDDVARLNDRPVLLFRFRALRGLWLDRNGIENANGA